MALVLANRVQETSTTTGTGTLTLAGAVLGYQTFAAGIGSGNTCYYAITSTTGAWEVGIGTVGTGTLARTTLLSSSTGSLVSFTGTLNVFVTYPSEKSVNLDASDNLTILKTAYLGGASGNQSLQVNNVASAVNYAQIVGAVTTGSPAISAQGTDTNVGLVLNGKGTGVVALGGSTAANSAVQISPVASAVNYALMTGATTGTFPSWSAQGTDTNIGFRLSTKGIANINFMGSNFGQYILTCNPVSSAVNFLQVLSAATTGAPELSAQGSDTNISLKLTPKGTGALQVTGTGFSPNVNLTDAATIAWDTTTAGGQVATFTFVSSNRTFGAPTNLKNGAFYALAVIQNAGSNTLTWNSVFKWAGGVAPTLSTAAGAKDYFTFRSDGTNLYQQGISQAVA